MIVTAEPTVFTVFDIGVGQTVVISVSMLVSVLVIAFYRAATRLGGRRYQPAAPEQSRERRDDQPRIGVQA